MTDVVQAAVLPTAKEAPGLHAGFWRRVAAYIIDAIALNIVIYICWIVVFLIFGLSSGGFSRAFVEPGRSPDFAWFAVFGVLEVATIVIMWLYFAVFESSRLQATPGKLALGLGVTDGRGGRIGFGRATGRYFAKFLSSLIFCIGYLMAGWTERKQALHDILADTCVVQKFALVPNAADGNKAIGAHRVPGWVIVLIVAGTAVFYLAIFGIIIAIAAAVITKFNDRTPATETVDAMHQVRNFMVEFHERHGIWPPTRSIGQSISRMYSHSPSGDFKDAVWIFRCSGKTCRIEARMRKTIANKALAGRTLELWTTDGGRSWHCGPGGSNPIPANGLPPDCRDPGAPGPFPP
ncbi:MAG TPA: RDD family protein [Gammaproteobacteria bacterium]|nr:RDD family protein [Gammaproteobacteria bacterium]